MGSSFPSALFDEQVLHFDCDRFPFAAAVLEEFVGRPNVETLNEAEAATALLEYDDGTLVSTWRPGKEDRKSMQSRTQSQWEENTKHHHNKVRQCKKLCAIYLEFLETVIAPELARTFYGDDHGRKEIKLVYQFPPTVRLFCSERVEGQSSTASKKGAECLGAKEKDEDTSAGLAPYKSLGHMHNDAEFGHQHGEVNFWLPLTDTNVENTFWLESAPARRDWRPALLHPGEVLRFHGTLCRHFTRINSSGKTRVSLDFRCTVPDAFDFKWNLVGSNHRHERREMTVMLQSGQRRT